jgi:hypothetical protein
MDQRARILKEHSLGSQKSSCTGYTHELMSFSSPRGMFMETNIAKDRSNYSLAALQPRLRFSTNCEDAEHQSAISQRNC